MTGRQVFSALSAIVTGAAIAEQLRRPADRRTWHGRIAGIPYDFRRPTMDLVLDKVWDPGNPSIMAPTLWGVGWSINLYRLMHPVSE